MRKRKKVTRKSEILLDVYEKRFRKRRTRRRHRESIGVKIWNEAREEENYIEVRGKRG